MSIFLVNLPLWLDNFPVSWLHKMFVEFFRIAVWQRTAKEAGPRVCGFNLIAGVK